MDNIEPLLVAKAVEVDDKAGWMYNTIEYKEKYVKREDNNVWEPAHIGEAEVSAINIMAMRGGYLPLDDGIDEYLKDKYKTTIDEVSNNLILTRLFMKDSGHIRPIKANTHIVTIDDNTGYVCDERDRFDLWCDKQGIAPHYINLVFLE